MSWFHALRGGAFRAVDDRLTRSAPGHVLISSRHPETRAIDQGTELNFSDPHRLHRFYSQAFRAAGPLLAFARQPSLALAVILPGVLEDLVDTGIDFHLLHAKAADEIGRTCETRDHPPLPARQLRTLTLPVPPHTSHTFEKITP